MENSANTLALSILSSHIDQWLLDQARYIGLRKNLFDLRRMAVVQNLYVLARMFETNTGEISHFTNLQSGCVNTFYWTGALLAVCDFGQFFYLLGEPSRGEHVWIER